MTEPQSSAIELADVTWEDLASAEALTLLVPVGSCEQHGPHLPLDTDTRIATAVARAAAAEVPSCVVAPAVGIAASGEHRHFPGTLSIGTDVLTAVLVEIARSALPPDGSGPFAHVVFVNGHGGNEPAVAAAVATSELESRPVAAWSPRVPGGDAHAGRTETSLLLHIAPAAVGDQRPVGDRRPLSQVAATLTTDGVAAVSANGVLGDATGANAEEGRGLMAVLVDDLVATVTALSAADS